MVPDEAEPKDIVAFDDGSGPCDVALLLDVSGNFVNEGVLFSALGLLGLHRFTIPSFVLQGMPVSPAPKAEMLRLCSLSAAHCSTSGSVTGVIKSVTTQNICNVPFKLRRVACRPDSAEYLPM